MRVAKVIIDTKKILFKALIFLGFNVKIRLYQDYEK
jgi:hypothetical protein